MFGNDCNYGVCFQWCSADKCSRFSDSLSIPARSAFPHNTAGHIKYAACASLWRVSDEGDWLWPRECYRSCGDSKIVFPPSLIRAPWGMRSDLLRLAALSRHQAPKVGVFGIWLARWITKNQVAHSIRAISRRFLSIIPR